MLEQFILARLEPMISPAWRAVENTRRTMSALRRVALSEDQIAISADRAAISLDAADRSEADEGDENLVTIRLAFHMRRRQGALILEPADGVSSPAPKIDRALVRAIVLARTWADQLERGEVETVKALARANGICHNYAARLLPLAYLAPDLAETILKGLQPRAISLAALTSQPLPASWTEQRASFHAISA